LGEQKNGMFGGIDLIENGPVFLKKGASMSLERIKQLLKSPEGTRLEYKEAASALPKNLFETICAMLNRDGGDILLGVNDQRQVLGVAADKIEKMLIEFAQLVNNPNKLDPTFGLVLNTYQLNGKYVLHIQVPASSQVHRTNGRVFDRNHEGDFLLSQSGRIGELYNRKRGVYSEGRILPFLKPTDLDLGLLGRVRNLIRNRDAAHRWLSLDDDELLRSAGLWQRDFQTGEAGLTLAAVLLLGKEVTIRNVLPHFKIDALLRVKHVDRYDDRMSITGNLLNAYDLLMGFVERHLPDGFYLDGSQRVSLRTQIFREVIANVLVHREYTNAVPCELTIYLDRVEVKNASVPAMQGPIDPRSFYSHPKNPRIASFFKEIGRVEELGTGVRNVSRLSKLYAGGRSAVFVEGDIFKTVIPLPGIGVVAQLAREEGQSLLIETLGELAGNEPMQGRMIALVQLVAQGDLVKVAALMQRLEVSERTIKDYLKRLTHVEVLAYEGSKKTGGYALHPAFVERMSEAMPKPADLPPAP
jgi:ATP-dependent DNA helicase RecG